MVMESPSASWGPSTILTPAPAKAGRSTGNTAKSAQVGLAFLSKLNLAGNIVGATRLPERPMETFQSPVGAGPGPGLGACTPPEDNKLTASSAVAEVAWPSAPVAG